jgi:hypothetical protein
MLFPVGSLLLHRLIPDAVHLARGVADYRRFWATVLSAARSRAIFAAASRAWLLIVKQLHRATR